MGKLLKAISTGIAGFAQGVAGGMELAGRRQERAARGRLLEVRTRALEHWLSKQRPPAGPMPPEWGPVRRPAMQEARVMEQAIGSGIFPQEAAELAPGSVGALLAGTQGPGWVRRQAATPAGRARLVRAGQVEAASAEGLALLGQILQGDL
jgi:hypothetical protein